MCRPDPRLFLLSFAVSAALVLPATAAPGHPPAAVAPVPMLRVQQPEIDAGAVEPGERVNYTFKIQNTGRGPLQIESIETNCGCVVADFDRSVPAGGVGTVRVAVDTLKLYGHQGKNIVLITNDPAARQVVLVARVWVRRSLEALPGDNITIPLMPPHTMTRELTLRCYDGPPLEISQIEVKVPYVIVEEITAPPGDGTDVPRAGDSSGPRERHYRISVPPTAPAEGFETVVSFHTNHPRRPLVDVRVMGESRSAMVISPPRLYFGTLRATMVPPAQRMLSLSREGAQFSILAARSSDPALQLQFAQTGPFDWAITLSYAGGWTPGPMKGIITVEIDDPKRPTIEIPFQADVAN